jgi:hypothetical protein
MGIFVSMSTSKLQRMASEKLSIFFGGYTIRENYRPEWMSTSNGGRLELDFYIEELSCAIEVQGIQHYEYSEFFHDSYDDYLEQRDRDAEKKATCEKRGIKLYEVFDDLSLINVIDVIRRVHDMLPPEPEPKPGKWLGPYIPKKKTKKKKSRPVNKELRAILRPLSETARNHLRKPTCKREDAIARLAMKVIRKFGEGALSNLPDDCRDMVIDIASTRQ